MQLFADSQTHFAAVSEDGRLKLWDVAGGALLQELKERDHLSYRYTCLAWTQGSSSKKSKKRSGASELRLVALGASNGAVIVWDLATGDRQGGAQVPRGIGRRLGARRVGGRRDPGGGSALRTFDLASGKKSRKLVSGLVLGRDAAALRRRGDVESSRFLFAGGARFVNMYDLQLAEHDAPALTFSLPSSADGVFARASVGEAVVAKKKSKKSKKNKKESADAAKPVVDLLVGATASAGAMFLWAHKYQQVNDAAELALASKPLSPTLSTTESAGILLAELSTQEDKKTEVLVARGSLVKPVFEKVSPVEENAPGQWKTELEFAEISDALLLKAERAEAASKNGNKRQKVEEAASAEDEKTHVPTLTERRALANSMAVVDETTSFEELDGEADGGE
ncbi:WD40 repeat-containing protein [Phytophthora cinnamomi]|uniref:WD40 repeat-containing protein n=1 Tax=Phytophthora cinnamomi TaxID=4785 RepID=UPI00355AA477|nr:WD40 repeat-containing protein [Phytophthora cinnamomi]